MDGADAWIPVLSYVEPRTNGLHVLCRCKWPMRAERGRTFEDDGEAGEWLWWRCTGDPRHVTRALPLPVRMARSV
jgi:hypothetical protein